MVIISAILILLIASMFVNAKAINDKTGKYDKISKWLDAGYKLLVVAYLYIMILKLAHPSIFISFLILGVCAISIMLKALM